jgi:hypothetical protein
MNATKMPVDAAPLLAVLGLFALSTLFGLGRVVKLIQVYEAQHELKRGSAGWIRTVSGWSMIFIWLGATWFAATIIGDWGVTGDLAGAIDRSWLRLRVLLEILAALAESD